MFALEVNFLTGRYVATAYNDRGRAEWPPHPARLFSALVAALHDQPDVTEEEERALAWLEVQPPPWIEDPGADVREVVRVFVPVNDVTVLSSGMDSEYEAMEDLRRTLERLQDSARQPADGEAAKVRAREIKTTEKELSKRRAKWLAVAQDAHTVGDGSAAAVLSAARVLPGGRVRQPRTFPSVTPRRSRVVFTWADAEPSAEVVAALDRIAARVTRLGHSSSLVSVRVVEQAGHADWMPSDEGSMRLRAVRGGQLERLREVHDRFLETEPRLMPSLLQPYRHGARQDVPFVPGSSFGVNWLVLRRSGGLALPMTAAPGLARQIRRILIRFAEEPVSAMISGHRPDGGASDRAHAAIVPLPFIGSHRADGRIMGVAIVLPEEIDDAERTAVYRAVANWEDSVRIGDEEAPELPVHLGPAGTLHVQRVEVLAEAQSLHSATWCDPASRWATATPIALDRNPGDLRSRRPAELSKAIEEATESIVLSCARIGLPTPTSVTICPAAPIAGGAKARAFPAYGGPSGGPRILTHARLEFPVPVRGPVLLGAGRYHGLGLLRPVRDHEAATN